MARYLTDVQPAVSAIPSPRWAGGENSAPSDIKNDPDTTTSSRITLTPMAVTAICPSSTLTTDTVYCKGPVSEAAVSRTDRDPLHAWAENVILGDGVWALPVPVLTRERGARSPWCAVP
jgi:hypothetical protein